MSKKGKIERLKKKWIDYKYDHVRLLFVLDDAKSTLMAVFAAALYAFAFYCFITPAVVNHSIISGSSIITGGVGGISQVITLICELLGAENIDPYLMQSILYFAFNVPILIFAFFKIGKRFAIVTLINVALSSVFIQVFDRVELFKSIASAISDEHLARVLFAGVLVGLASATAYKGDVSCGGIDVFSYYFALRKSTSVGKYSAAINTVIVLTYTCLTISINHGELVEVALLNFMYSVVYTFMTMLVVDYVNVRNKKVQLQIITSFESISAMLIANLPHSTTLLDATGGFSHMPKKVIYMTISSNEIKKVVSLVKRADKHAFITAVPLIQAYGNFFVKPVE